MIVIRMESNDNGIRYDVSWLTDDDVILEELDRNKQSFVEFSTGEIEHLGFATVHASALWKLQGLLRETDPYFWDPLHGGFMLDA